MVFIEEIMADLNWGWSSQCFGYILRLIAEIKESQKPIWGYLEIFQNLYSQFLGRFFLNSNGLLGLGGDPLK